MKFEIKLTYTHCVPITPLKINGKPSAVWLEGGSRRTLPHSFTLKPAPESLMEIKLRSCPTNKCATTSVRVHWKKTFAKICALCWMYKSSCCAYTV